MRATEGIQPRDSRPDFERLRERMNAALIRAGERSLGSREDAEDIAAETWIKVWRNFGKITEHPTAFVWRVYRNALIDFVRRRKWAESLDRTVGRDDAGEGRSLHEVMHGDELALDEVLLRREAVAMIVEAANHLPDSEQRVFTAIYLQEASPADLAALMDLCPRRINQLRASAEAKVKGLLAAREP